MGEVGLGTAFPVPCLAPAAEHTQTRAHTHMRSSRVGIREDSFFQLLSLSPWPSCSCVCHRECSSGREDSNRAAQVPGHSQPLALSQGEVQPRGPTPSSESPGFAGSGGQRRQGGKPLPLALPRSQPCSLPQCLPASPDSLSHKKQGVPGLDSSHLLLCVGLVGRGDSWQCPEQQLQTECQRNRALSDKACRGAGPAPGLPFAAALAASHPEPQAALGTTVVEGLPLGSRGGRPREKGGAAAQSRGNLLPAEGGAASR